MTQSEYFNKHIPHRLNLLTTFRERFSIDSIFYSKPDDIRDLYRCTKDISILMVRFFIEELGIKLKQKSQSKLIPHSIDLKHRVEEFGIKQLLIEDITYDPNYKCILEVLSAANRAVAHIDRDFVNHNFADDCLIGAINSTERLVKINMYQSAGFNFEKIVSEDENDMKRKILFKM